MYQIATDLVSAALRHVRDAELLADAERLGARASPDQAYHLAGFGPECIRKACLAERWANQAIGHGFGHGEPALLLVLALDRHAHRYALSAWGKTYPALREWDPSVRYHRTGACLPQQVRALLDQARSAVDQLVVALWADGRLAHEALC